MCFVEEEITGGVHTAAAVIMNPRERQHRLEAPSVRGLIVAGEAESERLEETLVRAFIHMQGSLGTVFVESVLIEVYILESEEGIKIGGEEIGFLSHLHSDGEQPAVTGTGCGASVEPHESGGIDFTEHAADVEGEILTVVVPRSVKVQHEGGNVAGISGILKLGVCPVSAQADTPEGVAAEHLVHAEAEAEGVGVIISQVSVFLVDPVSSALEPELPAERIRGHALGEVTGFVVLNAGVTAAASAARTATGATETIHTTRR